MSGLEIAGVLLGAFPLIISSLEHWRDVAKVGGFFWRVRKEYTTCRREVLYYEILYKRNIKQLLLPIVNDPGEVTRLVGDPAGEGWSSEGLQKRLEGRLQESYDLYLEIICEMNDTAEELRKELALDDASIQSRLGPQETNKQRQPPHSPLISNPSKLASVKAKWNYETFRLKFSFNEAVRNELFGKLKACNGRLEKLLSSSDTISALENVASANTKHTTALETAFKKAWKKSDLLFKAIQLAWQCSCQQYHFANLRLEHRTHLDTCFEIILTSVSPSTQALAPWSWKELQCGEMIGCSFPQEFINPSTMSKSSQSLRKPPTLSAPPPTLTGRNKLISSTPALTKQKTKVEPLSNQKIKLCQCLANEEERKCMGVIGYGDEIYHLHPMTKRDRQDHSGPLTLDSILSSNFEQHLTRRQRYSIALLLASSVAQLQFTPWLKTSLTKEDIFFFSYMDDGYRVLHSEPFIRQGFPLPLSSPSDTQLNDCNFSALGILLLELCFGQRLEEHPLRKKYPAEAGDAKQAFDLMAALKWSQDVHDEGGDDYSSAVKWCFFASTKNADQSWRADIIKNVISPLERCQEYFKIAATQ